MDEPRCYHTKGNKSTKTDINQYEIAYLWNLKKGYKWTYLQNGNRPTDIENKFMVTKGEREGER